MDTEKPRKKGNGSKAFYYQNHPIPETPIPEKFSIDSISDLNHKGDHNVKQLEECEDELSITKKKIENRWYFIALIVSILGAGFLVSQFLNTQFLGMTQFNRSDTTNTSEHAKLETSINSTNNKILALEETLEEIRIDQAREIERSKLIDFRIELILANTKTLDRSNNDSDRDELLKRISYQEKRLEVLERSNSSF